MSQPQFAIEPGEFAIARSVPGKYPLPKEIPENALVQICTFEPGFYVVQYNGSGFRVFMGGLTKTEPTHATTERRAG